MRVWLEKVRRKPLLRLLGGVPAAFLLVAAAPLAQDDKPKQVLVLHSFGRNVAPFSKVGSVFWTALSHEAGSSVNISEVPLDLVLFSAKDAESPLIDFMGSRYNKRQPDLVVSIGGPAAQFVLQNRNRLFADSPVLVTATDSRHLAGFATSNNTAVVTHSLRLPGIIEDVLHIQPRTTNVVLVLGASPLESFWREELKRELAPFASRVSITYLDEPTLDRVVERCANLPPRSFIVFLLYIIDRNGNPYDYNDALTRIHETANAPIYGLFRSQLGLGIVGGRLFPDTAIGEQAAHTAMRILRGEDPSAIPPAYVELSPPAYDERVLKRWGLEVGRLARDGEMLYQTPSFWQAYRWQIIGVFAFLLLQSALIMALIISRVTQRATARQLLESEARLEMTLNAVEAGVWSLEIATGRIWTTWGFRKLFGLGKSEDLDLDRLYQAIEAEEREAVKAAVENAIRKKVPLLVEFRVRKEGVIQWLTWRGQVFADEAGNAVRLMGVSIDITERKRAEETLNQTLSEIRSLRDRLQSENLYLREQVLSETDGGSLVGESEPFRTMLALAHRVAPTDSTVLITGETGTGKELLAQIIHDLSPRKDKPMVKVNCAALPAPLIESELFGRERGAYTGALTQQPGRFELADGSSILLDEIGDLPLDLQSKLLRVLEDGRFERLGGKQTLSTNVRLIAATNRNLEAMVEEGRFRADLFHRLNVFPIKVPPLRERPEDIPLLVWKFVQDFNMKMGRSVDSIPKPVMDRFKQYAWSGNIRELRNVIERAMIISEDRSLVVNLPQDIPLSDAALSLKLEDVERRHIRDVLARTGWRISGAGGAADLLGLVPTTLHSRLKKLGIARPG